MTGLWKKWLWDLPIGARRLGDYRTNVPVGVKLAPDVWLVPGEGSDLLSSEQLVDADGLPLAWPAGKSTGGSSLKRALHSFPVRHPWDLLRVVEELLGARSESRVEGEIHPLAVIDGTLELGKGSRILPGVVIEGHVVIGENCKIGPNAYVRGCVAIGNHCHVGNAVEIKNSLLMSHTCVGHLSYVGDSVLGEGVNLGAGTITANFRHDGGHGRAMIGGSLVDTGRAKLGAFLGDGVHTGIHTSIYPGRTIHAGLTTRPGQVVDRDLLA